MATVARAHPNVALVKYWGKRSGTDNLPATPSLSITLGGLTTRTSVSCDASGAGVEVKINGAVQRDPKIEACVARLVARAPRRVGRIVVDSTNDFPTAAGLASSASGIAALVVALDAALASHLAFAVLADEARRGSASAARSLLGGIVAFEGGDAPSSWQPRQLADARAWPLDAVIAVCSEDPKAMSSSEGMTRTQRTSPYYDRWLECASRDFVSASERIAKRDFEGLADVAEANCLAMHAAMLASRPPIVYWNGATVECVLRIRELRSRGVAAFFTIDAGPQVKAVCLPAARAEVRAALADVTGVQRVIESGLGAGAALERTA